MKKKKLLLMLLLAPFAMAFAQIEDNAETENNDDRLLIQPIAFAYDAAGNINRYSEWLNYLDYSEKLKYSLVFSSCVTHTSMALNLSGVFNLGIHPYLLHAQIYLWNIGIRPWVFCNYLNNLN